MRLQFDTMVADTKKSVKSVTGAPAARQR